MDTSTISSSTGTSPRGGRVFFWILWLAVLLGSVGIGLCFKPIDGLTAMMFVLVGVVMTWCWHHQSHARWLVLFLVALSVFRIWYLLIAPYDLSGDEAHYWEWTRRPDWCYYTKGPVVAWLIWLGTAVLGNTETGVRLMAVVLSFFSSLFLYRLGTRLSDEKSGAMAAALMQVVPIFAVYSVGLTIDSPLLFLWILALALMERVYRTGSAWTWLALGVAVGLGLMTKYTMVLFYPCALLFLLTRPQGRQRLKSLWPYLGVILSLSFMTPIIWWNAKHGWVHFLHNLGHTRYREGMVISPESLFAFVGGQLGVITPILLVMIVIALFKRRKVDGFSFWFSIPLLALFLLKSIQGKVHENWTIPAYVTGFVAFSAFYLRPYASFGKHTKRLIVAAVIIAVIGSAVLHYPSVVDWPLKALDWTYKALGKKKDISNPTSKIRGWKELATEVDRLSVKVPTPRFILSNRYMISSELAFYMKGQPTTYCFMRDRRMNQYDLWPSFTGLIGQNAIYVTPDYDGLPDELAAAFDRVEQHRFVIYDTSGRPLETYRIVLLYDFHGMTQPEPTKY